MSVKRVGCSHRFATAGGVRTLYLNDAYEATLMLSDKETRFLEAGHGCTALVPFGLTNMVCPLSRGLVLS